MTSNMEGEMVEETGLVVPAQATPEVFYKELHPNGAIMNTQLHIEVAKNGLQLSNDQYHNLAILSNTVHDSALADVVDFKAQRAKELLLAATRDLRGRYLEQNPAVVGVWTTVDSIQANWVDATLKGLLLRSHTNMKRRNQQRAPTPSNIMASSPKSRRTNPSPLLTGPFPSAAPQFGNPYGPSRQIYASRDPPNPDLTFEDTLNQYLRPDSKQKAFDMRGPEDYSYDDFVNAIIEDKIFDKERDDLCYYMAAPPGFGESGWKVVSNARHFRVALANMSHSKLEFLCRQKGEPDPETPLAVILQPTSSTKGSSIRGSLKGPVLPRGPGEMHGPPKPKTQRSGNKIAWGVSSVIQKMIPTSMKKTDDNSGLGLSSRPLSSSAVPATPTRSATPSGSKIPRTSVTGSRSGNSSAIPSGVTTPSGSDPELEGDTSNDLMDLDDDEQPPVVVRRTTRSVELVDDEDGEPLEANLRRMVPKRKKHHSESTTIATPPKKDDDDQSQSKQSDTDMTGQDDADDTIYMEKEEVSPQAEEEILDDDVDEEDDDKKEQRFVACYLVLYDGYHN
jgi:hypothetical protein